MLLRFQIGSKIAFANRRKRISRESHLAEEVVDPVELRLVDVLVELGGQLPGRLEVVPEGLLDHHPRVLRSGRRPESPLTTIPNSAGGISR